MKNNAISERQGADHILAEETPAPAGKRNTTWWKARLAVCVVLGMVLGISVASVNRYNTKQVNCTLPGGQVQATKKQCSQLAEFMAPREYVNEGGPVSAGEYYSAFMRNEARAELEYTGRHINIYGRVAAVRVGTFNDLTIDLHAGAGDIRLELNENQFSGNSVIGAKEKMATLEPGQAIRATCIGSYKALITPFLKNCIIQR